jgi:hypothetical protein
MSGNTVLPRFGERSQVDLIERLERAINALEASPLAGAVVLAPQAIGVTDTRVYHGLGQAPRYFWVVRSSADVRVFDGAVPEATDPQNYITLRASSAQTVTLAVV